MPLTAVAEEASTRCAGLPQGAVAHAAEDHGARHVGWCGCDGHYVRSSGAARSQVASRARPMPRSSPLCTRTGTDTGTDGSLLPQGPAIDLIKSVISPKQEEEKH